MGAALAALDCIPESIVASTAVRARDTAEPVATAMTYRGPLLERGSLYGTGMDGCSMHLRACDDEAETAAYRRTQSRSGGTGRPAHLRRTGAIRRRVFRPRRSPVSRSILPRGRQSPRRAARSEWLSRLVSYGRCSKGNKYGNEQSAMRGWSVAVGRTPARLLAAGCSPLIGTLLIAPVIGRGEIWPDETVRPNEEP